MEPHLQIIVTGCPGAGAEALAAGLEALGADGVSDVGRASLANALSDSLEDVGLAWPFADASFALATLDPGAAEQIGTRLVDAFAALPTNAVVTDERFVHLLPLALAAAPDAVTVIATRRAGVIAHAIEQEHGAPLSVGFALWEVLTARALRGASNGPVVVVDMDAWQRNPRESAEVLVTKLAALGVKGLDASATLSTPVSNDVRDPSHLDEIEENYATAGWTSLSAALDDPRSVRSSPVAVEIVRNHALLLDVERARHRAENPHAADASSGSDSDIVPILHGQVSALHAQLASLHAELDAERAERANGRKQLRVVSKHLTDLVNDTRHREANLQRQLKGVIAKLDLLAPRVRDMSSSAGRYHDHEFEIYRLRSRVLRKEEAIRNLRNWMKATNASVPLLPRALKDRIRFIRWDRGVTLEDIKPLPKSLEELRADADKKRDRDAKRHRDVERELGQIGRDINAGTQRPIVSEMPVAKIRDVLDQAGLPLRIVMSKKSPRRRPQKTSHQVKPRSLVIYTAISGGYDALKRPQHVPPHCDFVCFTDNADARSDIWQVRPFDVFHIDPTRMARYVKTHPHVYFPKHEHSIWIDANLLVQGDLSKFLSALDDEHPFAAFLHPHRQCVYEEAKEVMKRGGLDNDKIIKRQIAQYRDEGYPAKAGLIETNVLVRRHNDERVIALNNAWWREIDNGSKRDQMSLNYVAHRAGFKIAPLAERGKSVRNHPALQRFLHGADEVKA